MFEKEVDEKTTQYMNKHTEKYNCENTKIETDNYNAGLEQGYEDGFHDGAEFGYNKVNEWHFVKDGDLPKDEFVDEYRKPRLPSAYKRHYCLCLGDDCVMGKYIRGFFSTVEGHYSLDEVVAWKEIVLPIELRK